MLVRHNKTYDVGLISGVRIRDFTPIDVPQFAKAAWAKLCKHAVVYKPSTLDRKDPTWNV